MNLLCSLLTISTLKRTFILSYNQQLNMINQMLM
ncbi:hypothetical protein CoNPh17_CDS0100 [Staphylococcus phage S-CoN_Ph17]|nr:hypothetical protein CoNPh17_CDS0100 [Staphylococcus phage S-CoN_Ph17]